MKLWTTLEEKKLRELFPVYKTNDVAKMMGRSYRSVRDKAYDLGLTKEFDFCDKFLPGNKINPFKKGEWAKGCERTWFKPGNKLHSYPIGTETIRWGVVFVKVSDLPTEGNNRQRFLINWKRKKNLVWEAVNGPIPEGHFLTVLDGNQHNLSIENLALVTPGNLSKYVKTRKRRSYEVCSASSKKAWETRRKNAEARA